jgi:glucosylceramidase
MTAKAQLRRFSIFSALLILLAGVASSQTVNLFVSSEAGDRISAKPDRQFSDGQNTGTPTFEVNDAVNYQTIDGFGASLLEAGLVVLNALPPDQQERVLRSLFDLKEGSGFSAMKTEIAATDFQSAGPWYTYDDAPGDMELKNFSIARDLGPNGMATFIKRARKYGNFVLQTPMDYPPDWMLFDVKKKQDVDPKYFPTLARYYIRYLEEYQKQGIFIDYLSLFNEPGVYTKIPYSKILVLLRDHVGPALQESGLKTRIMLSEAPDRDDAYRKYPTVLDDPVARQYVAAVPYHGYDFKDYSKIAELKKRYSDLPFWMTEVCYAYEAGTPKSMALPVYAFEDGDFWGRQIFSDLESGASAWIYWNMILDERGGPWAISPIHGNPDPNEQHPVVVINRQTKQVSYTGLYYYLTHFSKFVRPGSVRLETSGAVDGVRVMSFRSPDGNFISELMNSRHKDMEVSLLFHQRMVRITLPAVSITSATWRNP